MEEANDHLVYDWEDPKKINNFVGFVDETIRDGLQCIQFVNTKNERKFKYINCMKDISIIKDIIIGMVGISDENDKKIIELADFANYNNIFPWVLCRMKIDDVKKVININNKLTGRGCGINLFISISDIRILVENWDFNKILKDLQEIILLCKKNFSEIRVALEDATRAKPDKMKQIINILIDLGVTRITIADTAGVATPESVRNIFNYIKSFTGEFDKLATKFEWHGHNDRGLAVANSIESIMCGVSYVHGTMLGIGERNGNASLDTLICNLYKEMKSEINWGAVKKYYRECKLDFDKYNDYIYPYFGVNSNRTSTGTHTSAIVKALKNNNEDIARHMFSGDSPMNTGKVLNQIYISPISGKNTIKFILESQKINYKEVNIVNILNYIKEKGLILNATELCNLYVEKCIEK